MRATPGEGGGYYAPLAIVETFQPFRAWTLHVGTTPNGDWVVEYHSIASPRYQRSYFASRAEALADVEEWCGKPLDRCRTAV